MTAAPVAIAAPAATGPAPATLLDSGEQPAADCKPGDKEKQKALGIKLQTDADCKPGDEEKQKASGIKLQRLCRCLDNPMKWPMAHF